jgi:hypothetical protein
MAGVAALGGALIGRQAAAKKRAAHPTVHLGGGPTGSPQTVTGRYAWYAPSHSLWSIYMNDWGSGLLKGTDYTTSATYYPANFPNFTTINWSYGAHVASNNVWGYPALVYGQYPHPKPSGLARTPIQLSAVSYFTMSWNIALGGSLDQYDVLFEGWLATDATTGTQAVEFAVLPWSPPYMTTYSQANAVGGVRYVTVSGIEWQICPLGSSPSFVVCIPTSVVNGTPLLSVTNLDMLAMLRYCWLNSVGGVTPSEYLWEWAFGVEPRTAAGSLAINNVVIDWG